ncbi:phosphotransferase family protein [Acuticoccus sp. MNP-M23]|uniref:phosphotransferase family protein n=1 Tax=Acuticoccus sp. MNP-M23 TaxID=3072793 RepID=UPI002816440E|nr:phosphotransferase family protein [Acuticoccus sp. MNP-M23]WMS41200.1 phosphotransferase family protein [Acuticoccus sp. MNP-M23]
MSAGQALDLDAVARWLRTVMPDLGGPLTAEKFADGQSNPTFRIDAGGRRLVLRRKPPGPLLKSAHAVEREFRVQQALAGRGVPVPRMIALCEDEAVIGTAFYVMAHVDGVTHDDPRLPGLSPQARGAIGLEMARVLAAIHKVDIDAAGLGDYGRPGNYYARQIERWTRQYRASETETIDAMEALIHWLPAHMPPDDGRISLVHGDYRLDNLLFAPGGTNCVAVLDWELSTIGHPFADLAALLMQWRLPPGRQGRGLAGVDRAAGGLVSDADFVAAYCADAGIETMPDLGFHLAFCFFRMAAILQGVKKRGLEGNASNPERAAELGKAVPLYAEGGADAAGAG